MGKFLDELKENEIEKNKFNLREIVFFTISFGLIVFLAGRIFFLRNDTTLIAYKAPEVTEMGAPIKLKRITQLKPERIQNMLVDFTRQYIRALYPKNSIEAKHHFDFITRHTLPGKLKDEYMAYSEDLKEIGEELDQGKVTFFSPVNSLDMRMRKKRNEDIWFVEIDGFLNNAMGISKDDRGVVTLRFEITYTAPSSEGSYSGWYVKSYEIITITDAVANNKEDVKANK